MEMLVRIIEVGKGKTSSDFYNYGAVGGILSMLGIQS